jgi:hypothetical protein
LTFTRCHVERSETSVGNRRNDPRFFASLRMTVHAYGKI